MTEEIRTYSMAEVASLLYGEDLKAPERWVKRKIKDGVFRAIRVGDGYRMTTEQLRDAVVALEAGPAARIPAGLISGSPRRRSRQVGCVEPVVGAEQVEADVASSVTGSKESRR